MMTEQDREYVGSVALVVLGGALDPDEVSRSLQLTPSQCWRKGEKSLRLADGTIRVRESEYEWGGWKLFVAGERKDSPIESQFKYWVDLLRSRTAALKRLRVLGYGCALDVFVTSSGTASIVVPHQLQKEVAALAVDIRVSFFADSEPERTGEPMPADKDNELDEISRSLHEARNLIRAIGNEAPEPYRPQEPEFPYCSFCGKGKSEVGTLVEGPAVFICDECVEKAQEIIRDRKSAPKPGI